MPSAVSAVVGTFGAGLCVCGGWMLVEQCREVEGPNVENVDGPNTEVMTLSAVAATMAEYKRALANDDFSAAMSLDEREVALLVGSDDHARSPSTTLSMGGASKKGRGIFSKLAGTDRLISKEDLLVYLKRETGSKSDSGLTEAVIVALFAAADEEQDGSLQENELVTFMRLYKYYCLNYTPFGNGKSAFRDAVLQPLLKQADSGKDNLPTAEELAQENGVEQAAITIHRVEHLPAAGEDGSLDAMVVAYQRDFDYKRIDGSAYAVNDDDDMGTWSVAERKIGSTEAKPVSVRYQDWYRLSWSEALWSALGWPSEKVKYDGRRSEFKCWAPGEVVLKLVDDNWSCDNVLGEARVAIDHPSDLGHDGDKMMFRAALYLPIGSQQMVDAYMDAPPWDGSGFPFWGPEYAGSTGCKLLGADGFPTVVVFSIDDWDESDKSKLRSSRRRRQRRH